jgi:methionyl-tRNA formyltransferase
VRLAFLGTPAVAVGPLEALAEAGHDIALVVTNRDKRRGRGGSLSPSPVKAAATRLGLTVTSDVDGVLALDPLPELGAVVAFGRLIKPHVLAEVPMVNLHFSCLPRWRGAAPVERAILAGDDRTGVCLMAVEEGLDTGGVYRREEVLIDPDETADDLRARLGAIGSAMVVDALSGGLATLGDPQPQEGEATYAAKLEPDDLRIDWTAPAVQVHRLARVGGAWTTHRERRLKVWRTALPPVGAGVVVAAGDGSIELVEVQPEGRARMPAADWARGARWTPGEPLGP